MAEIRLIDGNELHGIESLLNTDIIQESKEASWLMSQVLHDIDAMPTIAPETLPIVRELRAEIERLEKSCETWRNRTRKLLADAREISDGLNRAEAERDAAKRDIEKAMELSKHELPGMLCVFCAKNDTCVKCDGPEWRGVVAENATTVGLNGDHHD